MSVVKLSCFLVIVSVERLKLEQELRAKAESAAAEAERAKTVMAADFKDVTQKYERIKQELKVFKEKVISKHLTNQNTSSSPAIYFL